MFLKMSSGTEEYSDVWDIKPPLFHVRYPRKLKKRMKKCNLLKG